MNRAMMDPAERHREFIAGLRADQQLAGNGLRR